MADQLGDTPPTELDIDKETKTKSEENEPHENKTKEKRKLTSKEKLKKLWKMRMHWEKINGYPESKAKRSNVFDAVQSSCPGNGKSNFSICEDLVKQFRKNEEEKLKKLWKMRLEWEEENSIPEKNDCELQWIKKSSAKEKPASQSKHSSQQDKQDNFISGNVKSTFKQEIRDTNHEGPERPESISTLISKFLVPKLRDKDVTTSSRTRHQSTKKNDIENSIYSLIKKGYNSDLSTTKNTTKTEVNKLTPAKKKSLEREEINMGAFSPSGEKSSKPVKVKESHMNKSASKFELELKPPKELVIPEPYLRKKRTFHKIDKSSGKLEVQETNLDKEPLTVSYSRKYNKAKANSPSDSQGMIPDLILKGISSSGNHLGRQKTELNYMALKFPESPKYKSDNLTTTRNKRI